MKGANNKNEAAPQRGELEVPILLKVSSGFNAELEQIVEKEGYASRQEYIRHVLRSAVRRALAKSNPSGSRE